MAEALAVVAVVASIVQLVDFSNRVVRRLDEFHSIAGEIPKSFCQVKTELPLLGTTLQQLKEAIDADLVTDGSKTALLPVIAGCQEQVAQLDAILAKRLPGITDSWRKRGKKALVSLHHDAKVESITKILQNHIGILRFYYAAASSTLQPLTDAKLYRIRQWLSAPDPSTNYQKALKLRQADTGLWLLESDSYNRWKKASTTPLWLYGIPGCGKTILSSIVMQDVLQHCQGDPGKATAYFFFDFKDEQKQDPEMMVRSLLCQLLQQSIKIPASLDALFSSCDSGQRQPSIDALMDALQSMIQNFLQSYIAIDALDECAHRVELMERFEIMVGWKLPNMHLLVTSRRERDIESSLEGFVDPQNSICLQSEVIDKDIQRYVRQRLSDDKRLRKWEKDASMMGQIETVLMSGAKGMFRWAVCQLDELRKCVNRKMLQKALASLPPNLDQTYDRILAAIDEDYSQYAFRILQWLTFSARPLLIDEVAEVVAIDAKRDPAFDRDEVLEDPLEVLNICASLVTMTVDNSYRGRESSRQIVALAHYSVKEYLVSDRIWTGKAARYGMQDDVCHNALTTSCLGYLLQFQQLELKPDFLQSFKLALYSAEFWARHAEKTGKPTKEINEAVIRLCCKKEPPYANWVRLWDPDSPWGDPDLGKDFEDIPDPLYYVALLNLRDVVKVVLDKGADVNAQGGYFGNALQAASYRGYEATVKMLLDKDADVNI
ncbi:hypothetical protein P154DRAFT_523078 [Amniculicola lignicola CBS 123094]|uniref:Uncharacterized protein n=1 Tax=Amniculicola lignicola CBS 123094 TaxID=1392246 RepID=A0A6A5WFC9_9PLEO|nr:hypothetical protein P154DRAFT_523078 [Amniculicola lignicola CBS 123094]